MLFVAHSDPEKLKSKLVGLNVVCCLSMDILQGWSGRWGVDKLKKTFCIVLNICLREG